eukprot:TRINITY_DN3876_c0_g1_i1.p1 TRINITY_DN3876_c0_g1~~TRINITY_DN3876_c0_g1_i1.p1  ORF type:complete len:513 (-),score=120.77 TRINITY_DN3876_c0_g1_i1:152-1690(-)
MERGEPILCEEHAQVCSLLYPRLGVMDFDEMTTVDSVGRTLDVWLKQGFCFSDRVPFGFFQKKNGPCGVLVALQGLLLKYLIFECGMDVDECLVAEDSTLREGVAHAIYESLLKASTDGIKLVLLNEDFGMSESTVGDYFDIIKDSILMEINPYQESQGEFGLFLVHSFEKDQSDQVLETLSEKIWMFKSDLGMIIFLYSLILSRGIQTIEADMNLDEMKKALLNPHSDDTLIAGVFGFCTSAIINLITIGRATFDTQDNIDDTHSDIGYLTVDEDMATTIGKKISGDYMKEPKYPIWVIHGGSHYTILFSDSMIPYSFKEEQENMVKLYHYNGLPPGGPLLSPITITTRSSQDNSVSENPDDYVSFQVLSRRKNEVLGIYQYQVAYERGSPDSPEDEDKEPSTETENKPEELSDYLKENFFRDPFEKWRCMNCTLQTPPNWMAYNEAEHVICKECNKEIEICGYCPWVTFDALPRVHQEWVLGRYAPEIQKVLRQLWGDSIYDYGTNNISL